MTDTIDWVPKRLNAAPVVFRGMTGREVATITLGGLGVFTPVGILAGFAFSTIAMVPTVAFLGAGVVLIFGGSIMRRLRRGRPTSLLYRQFQLWRAVKGFPGKGERLITETSCYCIRRKTRAGHRS